VGVVSWVYKRRRRRRRREIVYCKRSSLVFLYTAVWRRIHSQLINQYNAMRKWRLRAGLGFTFDHIVLEMPSILEYFWTTLFYWKSLAWNAVYI
jgi:hypothetical protein